MQQQYRQGDVFLVRVPKIPKDAAPEKGPIILAHGEVTGHAHRVKSRSAKMFSGAGRRFLQASKAVAVEHEEHGTIELEPGVYEVRIQREYSPEAIRNVAD